MNVKNKCVKNNDVSSIVIMFILKPYLNNLVEILQRPLHHTIQECFTGGLFLLAFNKELNMG